MYQIKANIPKKKEIFALCFLSEKEFLFSGGLDQNIHIWNIDSGAYINTLKVTYILILGTQRCCYMFDL